VTPARAAVLERVAASVLARVPLGTVRVGIDGVDGAGKTMFGDELRDRLVPSGRPVIRATVDGFHNPKPVRYRRGRSSPEGFYRDSYDYATLQRVLLDPLGPGGTGRFRPAVFDVDAMSRWTRRTSRRYPDRSSSSTGSSCTVPSSGITGDYSIFLRVEWVRNHRVRDRPEPGHHRYHEGQNIYFRECEPWKHASIIIDNDDLAAPFIVSSGEAREPGR